MRKSVLLSAKLILETIFVNVSVNVNAIIDTEELVIKEICRKKGNHYNLYRQGKYHYDENGELVLLNVSVWNI